jgi:hypothetical protein
MTYVRVLHASSLSLPALCNGRNVPSSPLGLPLQCGCRSLHLSKSLADVKRLLSESLVIALLLLWCRLTRYADLLRETPISDLLLDGDDRHPHPRGAIAVLRQHRGTKIAPLSNERLR